MNDKVYIITRGGYSDYHICAVTLDKKRAKKLVKLYSDRFDKANIEEYTLNEAIERAVYGVVFDADGVCRRVKVDEYDIGYKDGYVDTDYDLDEGPLTIYWVEAADEAHAMKIAQDRYAHDKAKKEGIT